MRDRKCPCCLKKARVGAYCRACGIKHKASIADLPTFYSVVLEMSDVFGRWEEDRITKQEVMVELAHLFRRVGRYKPSPSIEPSSSGAGGSSVWASGSEGVSTSSGAT